MTPTSQSDKSFEYLGEELELFQWAENWKRYLASRMRPYLSGDVLEVGAGLGANVPYLYQPTFTRWVSLEPDPRLCEHYRERQSKGTIPAHCELREATLETLPAEERFDAILYIDVLEHIEQDKAEFERAYDRLNPNGHLLILCPAHNYVFSPFDRALGHFRRYNKRMYRELSTIRPYKLEYLDSIGMLASMANKLLLKQSYPNEKQIQLWDRVFVRLSRVIDPITFRLVGKSIFGIWRKGN